MMRSMGWIVTVMLTLLLSAPAIGADQEYKKYERPKKTEPLVELTVDRENWTINYYRDDGEQFRFEYTASQVKHRDGALLIDDVVRMDDEGIEVAGHFIAAADIGEIQIDAGEGTGETVISFMGIDPERKSQRFRRSRDRVSYWNSIIVKEDEFIRGSVVALSGDVAIQGEINGDVVAVFGDIDIGGDAVVRGDVISVSGSVTLDPESSVYGLVSSAKGDRTIRRQRARRWRRFENAVDISGRAAYNRVDGLMLMGGYAYEHKDSIIPSFGAIGGYAFASDRWRYDVFLTQTVLRGRVPVQVGGRMYRLLKSDDDRIIGECENSLFALLVNEDWKDYFEAEGGYGFARVGFLGWNTLEVGYRSETQNWLNAHPKLWSLFGAKDFRGNFSSVPYPALQQRRDDFDDARVASLNLNLTVDSRDDEKHPRRGWYGYAAYEYSPEDWKGDFDFKRFEAKLKRFQPLNRYLTLHLLAAYGRVTGDQIPLTREFFLGGLGTLHGYRHKEYMGHEYVLVSGEYRFRIPHSDISPFVQYDGGKIAAHRLAGGQSWQSSLSFGVAINDNLKIFASKRLDREDEDIRVYARFSANPF